MKNTNKIAEMLTNFVSKLEVGTNPHIKEILAIEAEFSAVAKSVSKMFAAIKETLYHTIYVGYMKDNEHLDKVFAQLWGEYLEQDGVQIMLRLPLERVFEFKKWMDENPSPITKNYFKK